MNLFIVFFSIYVIAIQTDSLSLHDEPDQDSLTQEHEPIERETLIEMYGKFERCWFANDDQEFDDKLDFDPTTMMQQIAVDEDPIEMARIILNATPFSFAMPSNKYSLSYLNMLNDVSINLSQLAPTSLTYPIEEQKARIEELKARIIRASIKDNNNELPKSIPFGSSFGIELSEEHREALGLALEIENYNGAVGLQKSLTTILVEGLLQEFEDSSDEECKFWIENIGLKENDLAIEMLAEQGEELSDLRKAEELLETDK